MGSRPLLASVLCRGRRQREARFVGIFSFDVRHARDPVFRHRLLDHFKDLEGIEETSFNVRLQSGGNASGLSDGHSGRG
jgi:hypothetical protein